MKTASNRRAPAKANKRRSLEDRLVAAKRLRAVEDAKFRARQAQGKLRRFVSSNFRKQEVIEALALRRGECNRCGACCEILFKNGKEEERVVGATSKEAISRMIEKHIMTGANA